MLQVTNLKRSFKSGDTTVTAVNDISFTVPNGQFASIVGRSGSGKSTLLSLLGALDKPTSGSISVDGKDITKLHDHALIAYRCEKIGFIFQGYNLVPNLTAVENVMLPMEFAGLAKAQRLERALSLLKQVGFSDDQMDRKPGKLSGGQQQRVAIARALANKPKLILADEPTGNLDSTTGKMIFDLLHDLARSENTTIIAVTHDLEIAGKTDTTFRLDDGKLAKGSQKGKA
ncbi:MAG: transporter-like protein putative transport system ATP-binding protein [Candidatus Saccharibacteria bacterium]|nr:transporter-like protein putative transport system ATP-binding protein [Candidatus Saccharibacteria bacterium]